MATWKKVIVSGSVAELSTISASIHTVIGATNQVLATPTTTIISGSFSGSFTGDLTSVLPAAGQSNFVAYNTTTGKFSYATTSSFTAATASYVTASNVFGPFGSNSVISSSYSVTSSFAFQAANASSASFATQAANASSASFATTASATQVINTTTGTNYYVTFVTGSGTSVQQQLINSGSFLYNAGTNTLTVTASWASNATNASTASYVLQAVSASFATSAASATSASIATNAVTASFVQTAASVANALTFSTGLSGSAATYNGSAAVNVAISGSNSLSVNNVPKWTGTGFNNSNIVDTGTQVQIGAGASSGVNVAAGGINVTGNSTFNSNLTVAGDLTVNGTASFVNSTNLYVRDQFITINSGSQTLADSGIIVQYATGSAGPTGSAFFLEAGSTGVYGRWAVQFGVAGTATSVAADEWMVTAKISPSSNPSAAPTWGSSTNGSGNMWINDSTGDIFIYA